MKDKLHNSIDDWGMAILILILFNIFIFWFIYNI